MAYTKQTWENLPSQTTPINADRLTHIEDGIFDAAATADTAASNASSAISGLADKVDKVEGKGLSTNDFTDALQTKLNNIEAGAEVNVQADYAQTDTTADDYIKNKPSLGTSAYKNSTSVVTDSSDLVESGAVKDLVGWGNKNIFDVSHAIKATNVVSSVSSDGVISIKDVSTAQWGRTYIGAVNLKKDKNYKFYFDRVTPYGRFGLTKSSTGTPVTGATIPEITITEGNVVERFCTPTYRGIEFTANADVTLYVWYCTDDGKQNHQAFDIKGMCWDASITDDTYKPYHASVSDSLAEKADNSVIAPVENGSTASQAYAVGSHAIRNGAFITWKNAKAQNETINDVSDYTAGDVADLLVTSNVTYTLPQGDEATGNTSIKKDGKTVVVVLDFNNNTEKLAWSDTGITINALPSATARFLALFKNVTDNTVSATPGYVDTIGHLYFGSTLYANKRYEIGFTYIL